MTRKSKREIETKLDDLEPPGTEIPAEVGPIDQWFSDEYPDPPKDELAQAWREALQPDNDTAEQTRD